MATRTFLFVDQVGSTEQLTRLGDRAAQQVRRALFDVLRQATEVHRGHEVDFTGDGMFCAFEGAADAVDAAVAMQQLVVSFNARRPAEQHLAIRIGLHTGEPLESEGGGYFGAAVVVAARLCSKASPGQILTSDLVRALVEPGGAHGFQPVGPLELKGVPEPVETFTVAWEPDDRGGRLPPLLAAARTTPFVGRRRQLDDVLAAWDRLADGGRSLVAVSGERGMGVTRLLAEAAETLRVHGASVWAGAGNGPDSRLAPWAEAVSTWAAATPRAELRLALGDKAADLQRLVPGIADLVPRLPAPPRVDPGTEVFLIADAVDELATRWSTVEPLVVVLDGLEEADPASLAVLRRVATSPRGGRVLLLAGYEPSAVGTSRALATLQEAAPVADLRLGGLAEEEVAELVARVTDQPVGESALRAVLAESEGNPWFVLQMARSLKERAITGQVRRAVDEAGGLRTDLLLKREEIALALRQLDQLRAEDGEDGAAGIDPDGTPPAPGDPPYRGLLAFRAEDAGSFFGRDQLVAEMLAALLSTRWLAVVGPSGSGKSSAVRAGLLPALARGALPGSEDWPAAVLTPGPDPVRALAAALAELPGADTAERMTQRLAAEPLSDVVGQLPGEGRLIVVVDQFEELWTTSAEDARNRTLDLLAEAATAAPGRILVVVCVRADQLGRVTERPRLAALCGDSQVLVPPMNPAELRAAVEQPARQAGWVLEPGLAQAVVDDVAGEPGALPLLSTALLETWERRRGRSLTLAGYAETGGARRAIATLADTTLDELDPADQDVARRLLLRLAAPTETGEDVARPAPLSELMVDEPTRRVLARLAERRLVTVGQSTAQVAHEALLREWPRLRGWLAADREGRRLHQQIATAAGVWQTAGRDDDALLRGARLAAAEDWRTDHEHDLTATERDYLTASTELRTRELRRARRTTRRFQLLAVVLVVLLAGAAVAAGLAVTSSRTADARATESTARGLAAQASSVAGTRVDTALLLAVEGYRRNPSLDTEGGLLAALNAARRLTGYRSDLPPDPNDAELSPDGSTLAVFTASGDLRLFDTATWQPRGEPLVTGVDSPYLVKFSPTGDRIAYSDVAGVHQVDARTGEPAGPDLGGGPGSAMSFSSDGAVVAVAGGLEPGITIRDPATGAVVGEIPSQPGGAAEIRPGVQEVAAIVAGLQGDVLQRFAFDGTPLSAPVPLPGGGAGMTYAPDGRHLLVTDFNAVTYVYDADTLAPVAQPIPSRGSRIGDGDFSPDGSLVALAADDGSVRVASVEDGFVVATLAGLTQGPFITFLDDSRLLALTPGRSVEYDLDRLTALGATTWMERGVTQLLVEPGGEGVLVGQGSSLVELDRAGEPRSGQVDLPILTNGPMAISADGGMVALLGSAPGTETSEEFPEGFVVVADRRSGAEISRASVSGDETSFLGGRLAFSPDGSRLAVGTYGGVLSVVEVPSGRVLVERQTDVAAVLGLLWSADGRTLYEGGQDGVLRFLAPETLDATTEIPLSPELSLTDVVAMPGSDLLAVSSEAGQVYFVDPRAGRVIGEPLAAEATQLQGIAISPDGGRVAAVSRDGALRLWDRSSGRAIGPPLDAHDVQTIGIAWLDEDRLLTGSLRGSIVAWDMAPARWVDRACEIAGRDLTRAEWTRYLPDQPYRRTCTDR